MAVGAASDLTRRLRTNHDLADRGHRCLLIVEQALLPVSRRNER